MRTVDDVAPEQIRGDPADGSGGAPGYGTRIFAAHPETVACS